MTLPITFARNTRPSARMSDGVDCAGQDGETEQEYRQRTVCLVSNDKSAGHSSCHCPGILFYRPNAATAVGNCAAGRGNGYGRCAPNGSTRRGTIGSVVGGGDVATQVSTSDSPAAGQRPFPDRPEGSDNLPEIDHILVAPASSPAETAS